jgi:NHL repeat/6-bladed beta-propeller
MKRNLILFAMSIVVILTMLAGLTASTAQSPSQSEVPLGKPGFSLRYVSTLGVTGEPYQTDSNHLYIPGGIFIDSLNNLFVVEQRGQRLLGFNSAGSNILTVGHAGVRGYAEGYLNFPIDVTTDVSSNLWVVMEHGIKAYDATGEEQLVYPNDLENAGIDNSHFQTPWGIAFDQNGYLFVVDSGNQRIQIYRTIGFFPNYVNTIGTTSTPGDDNTHFNFPVRVAFDSDNAMYVLDQRNYRVQKCTSINDWVTWTCSKFFGGTMGSDPSLGQLGEWPFGLSIDSANNVFIADGLNYRVLKCTPAAVCSHFVGTVGEMGSDNAHFKFINDVAIDSTGKVYVDDTYNMRIQVYTSAGVYIKTIGVAEVPYIVDAIHYNQPWGVATASNGGLYILENNGHRLIKVNPDGSQAWTVGKAGISGTGNDRFGDSGWWGDTGSPVETDSKVYVPDNGNHRIQIFDAQSGNYLATFGNYGQGNSQFDGPHDIAINPINQDILVADQGNSRVQIYNSSWFYKTTIGETGVPGDDNNHFNRPWYVAVDLSGAVYVADLENYRVQKCTTINDTAYTCSTFVGAKGGTNSGFDDIRAGSLALDNSGRLYDIGNWDNYIRVFDSSGAYLTSIGESCSAGNGNLCFPEDVVLDQTGNLFVADTSNHRIQIYSPGVPGWKQVNINGFGNPNIGSIPSLEVFKDHLYAGTSQSPDGPHHLFRTMNIQDWEEVSYDFDTGISSLMAFDNQLLAGTWKGSIYKSPDGLAWTQVMAGTVDMGVASFNQFDNMLYAGTYCNGHQGVLIWKSSNGTTWDPFASNNLDPNACGVISSAEFNGDLYFGVADWTGNTGGRIWRTDGTTVTEVVGGGFDDTENRTPGGLTAFGGWIFASISNPSSNQVWRSESGDPGSWSMVLEIGLGEPGAKDRTGLIVHDNFLYLTAQNDVSGMQVWRTKDGTTWRQVGYSGFGDSNNLSTEWSNSLAVFNDRLIIEVDNWANGAELWQYIGGLNYLPLITR